MQYDNDGLLSAVGGLTLTRNAQVGFVTGTTLGNVTDAYGYSSFGELTSYDVRSSGTTVFNVQYSRNLLGRIVRKTETLAGSTTTFEYGYDFADRLVEVKTNGATTATYTYDSNGNRLTEPRSTTAYTYDDRDRLLTATGTSPSTYAYTPDGDLRTKTAGNQTTTYRYDELGNLVEVRLASGTVIDYVIDGESRRIGKRVNGTFVQRLLYQDGIRPIAELDGANNVVSRFVYATGMNVPTYMMKGGATYRIVTDHLGSPRLIVDVTTGAVAQRIDYDESGNVISDTNPQFQPFGFAGGLYDRDTKLVRFGARDYDPETGRWTAADPGGFSGGLNLYIYADNDPINLIDPLGNDPVDAFGPTAATAPPAPPPVPTPGADPWVQYQNRIFWNDPVQSGGLRAAIYKDGRWIGANEVYGGTVGTRGIGFSVVRTTCPGCSACQVQPPASPSPSPAPSRLATALGRLGRALKVAGPAMTALGLLMLPGEIEADAEALSPSIAGLSGLGWAAINQDLRNIRSAHSGRLTGVVHR